MRSATIRLAVLICLVALCRVLHALDPHQPLRQYGHQTWQSNDGLPQNSIHAILQTSDGYLWLATEDGLVRFNGVDFTTFNTENTPQLKSNAIRSLIEDASGALWIGTAEGIVRYQGRQFTSFSARDGLPSEAVWFLHQQRSGQLIAATGTGLAVFAKNRWQPIAVTSNLSVTTQQRYAEMTDGAICMAAGTALVCLDGPSFRPSLKLQALDGAEINAIQSDTDGRLWVGTNNSLQLLSHSKLTPVNLMSGKKPFEVNCLLLAPDRTLWVGTSRGLARKAADSFVFLDQHNDLLSEKGGPEAKGSPDEKIDTLFADRTGAVWAGTNHGVVRVFQDRMEGFPSGNSLSGSNLLSALEDREGNLWLGTESEGATVLRDQQFTTDTADDGLSGNVVRAIAQAADGEVWIGTDGAGLNRQTRSGFTSITTRDGLSSNVILSIAPTPSGDLWVGTPAGLNLVHGSNIRIFTSADGLADDYIRSVYIDRDGSLWVGTRHGLSHRQGEVTTNYTALDGLGSDYIGALHRGRNGDLWICTSAGLTRMRNGHFQNFSMKDGLSGGVVTTVYEDALGTLWLGTNEGGLNRMRGDGNSGIQAVHDSQGLLPSSVFGILEDAAGDLWLSSKTGVYRARRTDLNELADGHKKEIMVRSYGPADGMKVRECSSGGHPAVARLRDGTLWFATLRGVAMTDPEKREQDSARPLPAIEQVLVDDGIRTQPGDVEIAPGRHRIEFRYTGLSFAAPQKVHYRYQLEGFDSSWVDAGNRRTAFYTNLPPRHYIFRVRAADKDGLWSERDASLALHIDPYFYQTVWFWLALAVLGIMLIWLIYRWRLQRVETTFSAVLGERNRIAREIHDTLAQGIVSISLQLEVVSRLLGTSTEAARAQLDQTRGLVRQSLADARSSIWDLRAQGKDASDLPARLGSAMQRIEAPASTQVRLQVTGTYRAVDTKIESELLRIAQEAVANALRHANANRIDVLLTYDDASVCLFVKDDGQGFNHSQQNVTMTGHFGIAGMKERAEGIGTALEIDSGPEKGTLVRVKVNL